MYGDKSLTPAETMRLAVLGALTEGEVSYADLATGVRHFVERMVGPSLELLGSSLEVLRLEGLIEAADGRSGDQVPMRLTPAGRDTFEKLMLATPHMIQPKLLPTLLLLINIYMRWFKMMLDIVLLK